jgi:hypothetical protein
MKNVVFWDVTTCGPLRSKLQLLVSTNVVPIALVLSTLMMETIHSSETSILSRATLCYNPEDGTLPPRKYVNPLESTGSVRTTCLNIIKPCILPIECVCIVGPIVMINSDSSLNRLNWLSFVVETMCFL